MLLLIASCMALALGLSCTGPGLSFRAPQAALPPGWSRFRLAVAPGNAVGAFGSFDPSFAQAGFEDSIYLAYSVVNPSYRWPTEHPHVVETRIAVSNDGGASFVGLPERATIAFDVPDSDADEARGIFGSALPFTWQHEVPSLVYVAEASAAERWQLFWHQYPLIDGKRRFEFGWIARKAAASPAQLGAARATKLFGGGAYAGGLANEVDGAPRVALNELHGDLVGCVAFTEPGAFVREGRQYLALHCADGQSPANGKIVLLEQEQTQAGDSGWRYRGTLLDNLRDAQLLGGDGDFTGFGAPDLFHIESTGRTYLVVTPTRPRSFPAYRGCMVFRVLDLETARLERDGATPRLAAISNGDPVRHNGACAYLDSPNAGAAALIQGQVYPQSVERFRLFRTETRL